MPVELFIKIGGVFHFICALSHIIFPKVFKWEENLKELPMDKKKVLKQLLNTSNICVALFWLIFAYIPFFYSNELLTSQIGKALLTCIIVFWAIRIFILQPLFFGIKASGSWLRIIFFLAGFMFFLLPWLKIIL